MVMSDDEVHKKCNAVVCMCGVGGCGWWLAVVVVGGREG